METKTNSKRLFFIDAMRAWAILMMLQGHFIDGLLDPLYRDPSNMVYTTWLYFRGITAPVFFTVSGFIFTYLLIRAPQVGLENPRVKKGIRRGLQLLLIGYLLRLNLFGLFMGQVYGSFYLVDVLHCIGLSILCIIGVYLMTANKKKFWFPLSLVGITIVLFLFEPLYKQFSYSHVPTAIANYLTKANGSVFTVFPWLGYATLGSALALLFQRFKNFKYLYQVAIVLSLGIGYALVFQSSPFFETLWDWTGIQLFGNILENNYLFIRLGDVFFVFALFMVIRSILTNKTILKIGGSTLTIYVIHFIVLYGSFTGLGLYKFLHHSLSPGFAIPGAVLFMVGCTYLSLLYNKHELEIKGQISYGYRYVRVQLMLLQRNAWPVIGELTSRIKFFWAKLFATVRN